MKHIRTIINKEWAEVFKNKMVLSVVLIMPILFAVLPALCLGAAALVLHGYPLTQERHAEIRAALEAARAAR